MDNIDVIKAIRAGDKEVIKDVYKDNAKDVYNFAKSITGDHDSAMNATKRTFVNLFTNIQKGDEPTNIRLAALKLAYDEACRIAMPSTENIDSPFDRREEEPAAAAEDAGSEVPQTDADIERSPEETAAQGAVVGDGIIDTPEEMNEVMDEESFDGADEESFEEEAGAADVPVAHEVKRSARHGEDDIGNTQVFSIKEAMGGDDDEIEMDEEEDEYDDEYDEYDDEDDEYESAPRSKAATVIIIIINVILALILIWLLYGLLVSFGVIPDIAHLGFTYTFFNEHIYPIF